MGQVNYNDVQYTLFAHGTGTSAITTSPVILYKIHCVTATATEDFEIRDGSGGNMILDIKASTGINTSFDFEFNNVLYILFFCFEKISSNIFRPLSLR